MSSSTRNVIDGAEPELSREDWARTGDRDCDAVPEPPRRTRWLRRLPFRMRLTLSFAVVIIVLFGGLALLLQTQFAASLDQGINRSLKTHAADLTTFIHGSNQLPQLPESGGTFAQIIDPQTHQVLAATLGHDESLLSPAQIRQRHDADASVRSRRQRAPVREAGRAARCWSSAHPSPSGTTR